MGELHELVWSDLENSTAGLEDGDAVFNSVPYLCQLCAFSALTLLVGRQPVKN